MSDILSKQETILYTPIPLEVNSFNGVASFVSKIESALHPDQKRIFFFSDGSGTISIGKKVVPVGAGLILFNFNLLNFDFSQLANAKGKCISFQEIQLLNAESDFDEKKGRYFFNFSGYPNFLNLETAQMSFAFIAIKAMEIELNTKDEVGKSSIIKSLIKAMMVSIDRVIIVEDTSRISNLKNNYQLYFNSFIKLLNDHFATDHSVQQYANKLDISPKKLVEVVRFVTGKPPSELIKKRIIAEAKSLLKSRHMSIKEIAFELGFEYPSHFTLFFKSSTKQSPKHYRNSISEIYN